MDKHAKRQTTSRIIGYDFARALAVLGMIIVNFKIVMNASEAGADWLIRLVGLLEGRAAATFVVLAGVGLALLSRRARLAGDQDGISNNRRTLLKRALFLFVVGLLYTPIWPADILHFYGIYIAIGAFLLAASDRSLWMWIGVFAAGFVVMMFVFDYEQGWDWNTLAYTDFWTPVGMARHLFFNGFHPVFPWTAFLLAGMWLGRQDMGNPATRRQILFIGVGAVILAEAASALLIQSVIPDLGVETAESLFGTQPMPPMPLYLLGGGGTAFAVIALSIMLTNRLAGARWLEPFISVGQLALTIYVAHVVIGMGGLEMLGMLENRSLIFATTSAIIFYGASMLFAFLWRKRFKRGPLEWVMRRATA